jgi:hypothetical protein
MHDQRGKSRYNGTIDIGAVEYYNERVFNPASVRRQAEEN